MFQEISALYSTRVVWKLSDLAYNRRETRDKQLLGRDPGQECAAAQSMDSWAAIQKASQECGGDTSSCPGPYPTAACPEFNIGCRLGRELSTLPVCCPHVHGVIGCDQKSFIILIVWRWHQLLSDSLTKGRLPQVLRRLGRKLFKPPSYYPNGNHRYIISCITFYRMLSISMKRARMQINLIWSKPLKKSLNLVKYIVWIMPVFTFIYSIFL